MILLNETRKQAQLLNYQTDTSTHVQQLLYLTVTKPQILMISLCGKGHYICKKPLNIVSQIYFQLSVIQENLLETSSRKFYILPLSGFDIMAATYRLVVSTVNHYSSVVIDRRFEQAIHYCTGTCHTFTHGVDCIVIHHSVCADLLHIPVSQFKDTDLDSTWE